MNFTVNNTVSSVPTVVTAASCILSLIGASLIALSYLLCVELRSRARRLLLFLSLVDFTSAAGFLWGVLEDFSDSGAWCQTQAVITTFSNTSSFFWTTFIAINLYISLAHSHWLTPYRARRLDVVFHAVAWLLPGAAVGVALGLDGLGNDVSATSVGWCWVNTIDNDKNTALMWMLLTGKVWEISAYFLLPVFYFFVHREMRSRQQILLDFGTESSSLQASDLNRMELKLVLIPLVFIFLRFWSTLRFVFYLTGVQLTGDVEVVLMSLHGVGNTFQGGANCLLFCIMTRTVRQRLCTAFCALVRCKSIPRDFYETLN